MASVFSPEDVAAGRVPEPGAHQQAATNFFEQVFHDNPYATSRNDRYQGVAGIQGGLAFGSIANKGSSPSLRSDVDILITCDSSQARIALATAATLADMTGRPLHVPMQLKAVTSEAIRDPRADSIFLKYLGHVQLEAPQWSRNDPIPPEVLGTASDPEELRTVALKICQGVMQYLDWFASRYGQPLDIQAFEVALDVPKMIGRRVLPAAGLGDPWQVSLRTIYDKQWAHLQAIGMLHNLGPENEAVVRDFIELSALDHQYTQCLERTLGREMTIDAYAVWLNKTYLHACTLGRNITGACVGALRDPHNV